MIRGFFFFQAEDGIRDLARSRGLGDVYKRQVQDSTLIVTMPASDQLVGEPFIEGDQIQICLFSGCLLYTSDAADERSSVDLGGRRIIKKKKNLKTDEMLTADNNT